jgi:phage repressor protein C with HTH and peptisase S24 domain
MFLEETVGGASATKKLMDGPRKPGQKPPIAERLKSAREAMGWSQPELADRVGMSQQGIAAIESGSSRRPQKIREIARAVQVTEAWLLGETEESAPAQPAANASLPPTFNRFPDDAVPVFGRAEGGADGRFILNGQRIGTVFCPPALAGVEGAYAVYVYGESMVPKFEPGELVWLHPYVPVKRGDYVVAQVFGNDEADPLRGFVKQFVSRNSAELVLRQLNPPDGEDELIRIPADQVFSVHKVLFSQLT